MSTLPTQTIRARILGYAALTLLVAAMWWVFRPDGGVVEFNSDTAIPVMMTNSKDFTPFDIYYWSQDRFGGLPMLVLKTIGITSGIRWSAFGLFGLMLAGFVASTALCAHWGGPRWRYFVPIVALIPGLLFPKIGVYFFGVEQVYGWTLIFLLPVLLLLLRAQESAAGDTAWRTGGLFGLGVFFFGFLSIWQSYTCLFYLIFAWGYLWVQTLFFDHHKVRASLRWLCFSLIPIWGAWSAERKLHRIHARWSFKTYGLKMVTPSDMEPAGMWWNHMQSSFRNWEIRPL